MAHGRHVFSTLPRQVWLVRSVTSSSLYGGEPNFENASPNFLTHINSSKTPTSSASSAFSSTGSQTQFFLVVSFHTPCARNVRIRSWCVSSPLVRQHSNNVDTNHRILAVAQPVSTELPLRTQPDDSTFEYAHLPLHLSNDSNSQQHRRYISRPPRLRP